MTSVEPRPPTVFPEEDQFFVKDLVRQFLEPPPSYAHRKPPFRGVTVVAVGGLPGRLPLECLWAAGALEGRQLQSNILDLSLAPDGPVEDPAWLAGKLEGCAPNLALCPGPFELPVVLGALQRLKAQRPELRVLLFGPFLRKPGLLLDCFPEVDLIAPPQHEEAAVALAERLEDRPLQWPEGAWSRIQADSHRLTANPPEGVVPRFPAWHQLSQLTQGRSLSIPLSLIQAGRPRSPDCYAAELALLEKTPEAAQVVVSAADSGSGLLLEFIRQLESRGLRPAWALEDLAVSEATPQFLRRLASTGLQGVRFRPVESVEEARRVQTAAQMLAEAGVQAEIRLGWGRPTQKKEQFQGLLRIHGHLRKQGVRSRFTLMEPRANAHQLDLLPEPLAPAVLDHPENRLCVLRAPAAFPALVYEPHPQFQAKAAQVAAAFRG